MTASFWVLGALACAQAAPAEERDVPTASSKIVAVTVYQGQALVTREVSIPEGLGAVEVVVTPLPPLTIPGSLFTEGTDGLRVLNTRSRTRVVKADTREAVRNAEAKLNDLLNDAEKRKREVDARDQDLQYLHKLETFTGSALSALSAHGTLESEPVVALSDYIMTTRAAKIRHESDLQKQIKENAEAADFVRKTLAELREGPSRAELDAVIVVQKTQREAGKVRLGYLVGGANWTPQYRLKGAADDAPVRLEYLAALTQQTGEDWPAVRLTLSTARPSQESAPPELLPLKLAVSGETVNSGPIEATDDRSRRVAAELNKVMDMHFHNETPLEDVIKYVRTATTGPAFPDGIPIYLDPIGLQEAEKTETSPIRLDLSQIPLRTSLKLALKQLGMLYYLEDGLLKITSETSEDIPYAGERPDANGFDGPTILGVDVAQGVGGAVLNAAAANDQTAELHVAEGANSEPVASGKENPSVRFNVVGGLDVPSRLDPQLIEVARIEMPAEYYAKAVPVLTPRVFRLAKLTNKSDLVILPGEATVHSGGDFVGRMKLPLVAAGEPFLAGFGVDPQLQVSRRLVRKTRTVQGGNQIFSYEFRIGLRNYRPGPVKVELWDRLPKPEGEAVAVSLVKTSLELSTDPLYHRTARLDNMLRWDIELPRGTIGDKTLYLNYELRLEYARDLPQPRFLSGSLREGPIGGGAIGVGGMGGGMGGMGGMGGGFRSIGPKQD